MKIYEVYEQFGDAECYATEQGVIEIANNDRTKEDGTEAEEFTTVEDAIKFLKEERLFNVEELNITEINVEENYVVINGI